MFHSKIILGAELNIWGKVTIPAKYVRTSPASVLTVQADSQITGIVQKEALDSGARLVPGGRDVGNVWEFPV